MAYAKLINEMTHSFSRDHSYEQCPYYFYLKYIENRDGESNYYAANGKAMHEVFEELFSGKITIDECPQAYSDKYDLICERVKQSTMDKTFEVCMDYLCQIDDIDRDKYEILGVEMKLEFKIGKYKFQGYVDLLVRHKETGEVILIDHKQATHFMQKDGVTPLKNQLANFVAYKKQMYIYCKGLLDTKGIQVDKIVWNHFKENKLTIIPFKKEEMDKTCKWVEYIIEKIKKDKEFKCNQSYMLCHVLCDYRNDCEYNQENDE